MNTKTIILSFLMIVSITLTSCKNETKKTTTTSTEKTYSIEPLTTKVGWTAYKTTDKVAVKGEFTKINITAKNAATAKEAINNSTFSIPVSSIFSKNEARDNKLKQFFFGVMDNTELLSGTVHLTSDTEGNVELKMNGITKTFPISYTLSGQMATIEGTLNLEEWNAQTAVESLNKVCGDLHKGSDGVSKTWSEVKINIATYLKIK